MNTPDKRAQRHGGMGPVGTLLTVATIFGVLVAVAIPAGLTGTPGIQRQRESTSAVKAHNLAIAAFNYSNDHNGVYPFGTSSTKIFQILYNERYLQAPGDVFLTRNGGKNLALASNDTVQLKPENVSWDFVTRDKSGLTGDDSKDLPLLFSDIGMEPDWGRGVNQVTLTASDTWGTAGVSICTLDQMARFIRTSPGQDEVSLTSGNFHPVPGVKYVTRKP